MKKQLSKRSKFLLLYLAKLHPIGVSSITPIHGATYAEQPGMVQMRGLIRGGLAYEATMDNLPWGRKLGIFYITEKGIELAKKYEQENSTQT